MRLGYHIAISLCMLACVVGGVSCAGPVRAQIPRKTNKVVMLDCYFNNEWRRNSAGELTRYHYIWDDSTDSGYSQLAGIITKIGGEAAMLPQAPTADALRTVSIYMIVDPDTPEESPAPHYIDDRTIDVLEHWVETGGVLMLFGNDKGKAEFEHLNRLAGRFGIHFNEDSRNRVTGDNFAVGTFDTLPDHPVFTGVRRIFIKELSTLKTHQPATTVLSEGGDVIMAFARVGKGGVFAVGDPWFYNEYMDARRLPGGYDNPKAAENLFRWLLGPALMVH